MWAGGSLSFHRPIYIGEALEQRSRVHSVTEKVGRTGPMVLVKLQHEIHGAHGLAIEEQQDIVFLEIPNRFSPPEAKAFPSAPIETFETPETLLFRYSAITFNAHRIHYDRIYAREIEHYPGLVVHGPLQASLLMRAATREKGRPPVFFDFRSVYPMFSGAQCKITFHEDDEGLRLWTGQDAHQCMQARAVWDGTV
jgi:3-methylfumaryl-CoA hydratase